MNTDIKIATDYIDSSYKPCSCEKKIIRKPIYDDNIMYCELCDCPILVEDEDKIVDDWRHTNIEQDKSLWYLWEVLRRKEYEN